MGCLRGSLPVLVTVSTRSANFLQSFPFDKTIGKYSIVALNIDELPSVLNFI
jgi:hypothetical protein